MSAETRIDEWPRWLDLKRLGYAKGCKMGRRCVLRITEPDELGGGARSEQRVPP
jgi:hypothetical protein